MGMFILAMGSLQTVKLPQGDHSCGTWKDAFDSITWLGATYRMIERYSRMQTIRMPSVSVPRFTTLGPWIQLFVQMLYDIGYHVNLGRPRKGHWIYCL